MSQKKTAPSGYREKIERSPLPVYAFGAVFLLYAVCFPFYKPSHYTAAAVAALLTSVVTAVFAPKKVVYIPKNSPSTGDADADAFLLKGREMLLSVRRADDEIKNERISAEIRKIEEICGKIFSFVEKNAEKEKKLRRFMDYYLPTTVKLLNEYSELEKTGVSGENIDAAKEKIENLLGTVKTAFEKQLDSLYYDTALDVSAEITVMQSLLAAQGLLNDKEDKQ